MKRFVAGTLGAMLCSLVCFAASPAATEPQPGAPAVKEKRAAVAVQLQKPVRIDGNLSDWPQDMPVITLTGENRVHGATDISGTIRVAWDKKALYLGCAVKDATPGRNTFDTVQIFQGDCVELAFGANPQDDVKRASYGQSDYRLIMNATSGKPPILYVLGGEKKQQRMGGKTKFVKTEDGYILEARVPFSIFKGFKPQANTKYGADFVITDSEDGQMISGQVVFSGNGEYWGNPSLWGTLLLQ